MVSDEPFRDRSRLKTHADCGQQQTMNHTVETCPLTKFEGGLNLLHKVDDDSHMAGIYSDSSAHEIIILSQTAQTQQL